MQINETTIAKAIHIAWACAPKHDDEKMRAFCWDRIEAELDGIRAIANWGEADNYKKVAATTRFLKQIIRHRRLL